MKIALIQPPVWWTIDPPLGLAQVAGTAKHHGHEVSVFDLNMELWARRGAKYENLWDWEQFQFWTNEGFVDGFFRDQKAFLEESVQEILRTDARVIGFSVYLGGQLATLRLARMIKAEDPKRVIVLGGQFFFRGNKAQEMLSDPAIDAVVCGPADESFPKFLARLDQTGRPEPMPGVMVRTSSGCVDGGAAEPLRDLDATPFADFTSFPMERYTHPGPRIPMNASRGCVWRCRFCSTREFWAGYTYMSGARIFAEVMHQRRLFPQFKHVEFYDITFNGSMPSLQGFADAIFNHQLAGNKTDFGFKVNAILRPEMTLPLLKALHYVGLTDVIYGVESGSPRVLQLMNKPFTMETAESVLRDTHNAGINTTANFMFGFPGETEDDFQMTLDFLKRNEANLDRVYASATFTSLEEHSYLTEHQAEFGIQLRDDFHHLYWETADGTNNYLVRQDRYERFRKLAISLEIDAYKGVNGTVEKDRLANQGQYHRYKGNHFEAITKLFEYLEHDFYSEPMRVELEAYRRDLRLLRHAWRRVRRANSVLGGHPGLSVREMLDGAASDPGPGPLAELQRWVQSARQELDRLRDAARLELRDGKLLIVWGGVALDDRNQLDRLCERAGLFLSLAESEVRSGEAQGEAPVCAR